MTRPGAGKFLLLLGPSGVGKSRIIWALRKIDPRYTYISPYTNRQLRDGETDKSYVTNSVMDRLANDGKLLIINEKFGFRYATPKQPILDAFTEGRFPLLDWPIDRIGIMREAFGDNLFSVYVRPPSLEVLVNRLLADNRDPEGIRLNEAAVELRRQDLGEFINICDYVVINDDGQVAEIAQLIHERYIRSLS